MTARRRRGPADASRSGLPDLTPNWLRFAEMAATALFWWYPVAWWVRRQLRRTEELCCDEWVRRLLPAAGPAHARGLLKAAAFTSGVALPLPVTAPTALRTADLRERLDALLGRPPRPPLGPRPRAALAALAAIGQAGFPTSCRPDGEGELRIDLRVVAGAPGDPLAKYVGLPVKILPEPVFAPQLEAARARVRARAG